MTLWLDAQLSPAVAKWISETFSVSAIPVREIELRDANDAQIFQAARDSNAIVLTKDADFLSWWRATERRPKSSGSLAGIRRTQGSRRF